MGFVFDGSLVRLDARVSALEGGSIGNSTPITSTGSTTGRQLAERFAEAKNVLDFGAAGDGATDDHAAFVAARDAASSEGGGVVYAPPGRTYRIRSPFPMASNVSLVGGGRTSVLSFEPVSLSFYNRFSVTWEGSMPDYPTRRPLGDEHALALIPISPAAQGATQITASPSGGFDDVAVGDWLMVQEGASPKWNTKINFAQVTVKAGDTLTLAAPLDLPIDGSTGLSYGVTRISPILDAWMENLTVKTNSDVYFHGFLTGLAVRGGIRNVTFDPYVNPTTFAVQHPYANDVHQFTITDNHFLAGNFGGFNRSTHSVFERNLLSAVGASDGEYAEGAAFDTISHNWFVGCKGSNPVIGVGVSWSVDISHNHFIGVDGNSTVKLLASNNSRVAFNEFRDVLNFPISLGTSTGWADGNTVVGAIIVGNDIQLKPTYAINTSNVAIAIHEYPNVQDSIIALNKVSHYIKAGTGNWQDDRRTLQIFGNTGPGITQSLPEPTRISMGAGAINASLGIDPTAITRSFDKGEIFHSFNVNASGAQGYIITVGGTTGTLTGVTGSINSGETALTVNSATNLKPGQYITIVGVSGIKKIVSVSGLVATIDSTASATVSGAAVAFSAPSWNYLPGSAAASQADSVAATVGALVTDFNSLLAKLRTAKILT